MAGPLIDWSRCLETNADGLRRSRNRSLLLLIVVCAAIRVIFWQLYEPDTAPDTSSYVQFAEQIARMDLAGYLGRRTPMYPLLLAAANLDYTIVWQIQSALGVGISVLVFLLVLECVPSMLLAFAVALLHSLTLNQLFYEARIMSETLATFGVLASVLLFVRALRSARRSPMFVAAGLVVAATILTRPQYVYLLPLFVVLMLLTPRGRSLVVVAVFVAAAGLPLAGWALFNKIETGYLGLSTQMGISLAQHSGKFIDKAPQEFAALRDIYLRHRARMPPEADHMTVWEAVPDMLAKTGLSFIDLNRELTRLSLTLFARHPGLYLRSVVDAWIGFWPVPNTWQPELIRGAGVRHALVALWSVEHVILRAMNLAFFLLAVALAPRALTRALREGAVGAYLTIGSVVLGASVVQALLEATDNARYSIPTQPLVAIFVLALAYRFLAKRRAARGNAASSGRPSPG
jgi:hypothetical protein